MIIRQWPPGSLRIMRVNRSSASAALKSYAGHGSVL
jgi:hypothetical protein